jgi:aspartate aminotransferase-like enzyme
MLLVANRERKRAMDGVAALTFKIASEPWEFEQIHRLNYKTFVDEIPQHPSNERQVLVDRFHDENVYAICLRGREVVGMMALRCKRPFSLDQKVPDLDRYLPAGRSHVAEIRLLATEKDRRGGRVFMGLMVASARYLVQHGYDMAVISGTTRQLRLYRHMGFESFGPLIGTPGAMYQPMYLTRERFEEATRTLQVSLENEGGDPGEVRTGGRTVSFLPGPVDMTPEVREAFAAAPVSHRAKSFLRDFRQTQGALRTLVKARHVQILTGSGTLANDVVGAHLSMEESRGLILSNGEFGDRLVDHARRMRLDFLQWGVPWGDVFDPAEVQAVIDSDRSIGWVWAVHSETSTGVLNDLDGLKALCARRGLKLAMDCISSIGTMAVDLSGVHLASGVSGKGLRGYPGLGLVFHDRAIKPASDRLPRYLDLGYYAEKNGVPFTVCSNLLYALKMAVEQVGLERFAEIEEHAARVRAALAEIGLRVIAPAAHASPAVITIALPAEVSAVRVGDALAAAGVLLSYRSDYLLERNWVQICLMGQYDQATVDRVSSMLGRAAGRGKQLAGQALATLAV